MPQGEEVVSWDVWDRMNRLAVSLRAVFEYEDRFSPYKAVCIARMTNELMGWGLTNAQIDKVIFGLLED